MGQINIYIVANGCHENRMDAALLKRYLSEKHGFAISNNYKEANIIIVMGCSVTAHMEKESIDLIDHFRRYKSPETRIAVQGCLSKLKPELALENLDGPLPLEKIDSLMQLDEEAKRFAINKPYENDEYVEKYLKERKKNVILKYMESGYNRGRKNNYRPLLDLPFQALTKYKAYLETGIDVNNKDTFSIKISTGCAGRCSYCNIKLSRGEIKSKRVDDIIAEFERGLEKGYKQFALLGTDIGDYGKDINSDLHFLLKKLVSYKTNFRLRLRNINPRWVIHNRTGMEKLLRSRKIIYIQSPIQSANNRILELMNRGYQAQEFISTMQNIHQKFPFVVLKTQIIVGFPTETKEEFEDTLDLVNKKIFDYVDVFRFTPNEGTIAATIEPQVPFDEIVRRYSKLFFRSLLSQPIRKFTAIRRLQKVI